jgi:hypothetical protein
MPESNMAVKPSPGKRSTDRAALLDQKKAPARRQLQKMSPYISFVVLLVPLLLVEPLKIGTLAADQRAAVS